MSKHQLFHFQTGIIADSWLDLPDETAPPAAGSLLISVERFLNEGDELRRSGHHLGVRVGNTYDVTQLAAHFEDLGLIALDFPVFMDGRAFSQARQLRDLGYRGELRACGNLVVDQLLYLCRCGFDTFALPASISPEKAKAVLNQFSVSYQPRAFGPELRQAG